MVTQSPRILPLAGASLIVLLTTLAYLPALRGGFLIDDNVLLTENPLIKAPDGLYRIWFTTEPIDYWPIVNSSFWVEWRLWGMNASGYHVTNLILHVAEALLIWALLLRLKIPGAFVAALLFALHPVNVESVAWIAQRKNLLALLFALLSALFLVESEQSPRSANQWYVLSLAAFVLAMLSKGTVAVLPVLLCGVLWWQRPLAWRDGLRLAPFYLISVALTLVNLWFLARVTTPALRPLGVVERALGAATAVWFYLYKALLPFQLSFVYPKWEVDAAQFTWWIPFVAAAAVTCALWGLRNHGSRALLFAWLYFCVSLAPVLGFTDSGFMEHSLVADHYQHLALIGVAAIAGAAWSTIPSRWFADSLVFAVVAVLAVLTHTRNAQFTDATTLFRATVERNPESAFAANNLGLALLDAGNATEASTYFERALEIKPDYPEVHYNLGRARYKEGEIEDAIQHYRSAVQLKPEYAEYHHNLATALAQSGQLGEAVAEFEQALKRKPDFPEAHYALGLSLAQVGRQQSAMEHFEQALRLDPSHAEAQYNLGTAFVRLRRFPEAIEHLEAAVRLKPEHAEAHNNLGGALFESGRLQDAIEHYAEAARLKPDFVDAQSNLGRALFQAGKPQEAIPHFQRVIQLTPTDADAHNALGVALAQTGQLDQAIEHLQEALRLRPDDRDLRSNLDELRAMKAK